MPATLEDAHITFHYSNMMATGAGFGIWNRGEAPVEGFTTTSWMLLLALGLKFHLSPFVTAKLAGLGSLLAMIAVYFLAYAKAGYPDAVRDPDRDVRRASPFAAVLTAAFLPTAWYAMSGMETVFFAAQVLFALYIPLLFRSDRTRIPASIATAVLLVATRPEGLIFGVGISGFHILRYSRAGWSGLARWALVLGATTVLAFLLMTIFRVLYFDSVVPNTALAKATNGLHQIKPGLAYVFQFAVAVLPLCCSALAMVIHMGIRATTGLRPRADWLLFLILFAGLYTVYIVAVGGDPEAAFPMWRHFVHLMPFWTLAFAMIVTAFFDADLTCIGFTIAMAACVNLAIINRYHAVLAPQVALKAKSFWRLQGENPYFTWISKYTDNNTLSAVSLAGQWSYYVPGSFVDMLGLSDAYIAKHGHYAKSGLTDSKTDINYVLSRKPDILEAYVDALAMMRGNCPIDLSESRREMLRAIFDDRRFMSGYLFVTNASYNLDLPRVLFVSQSFYAKNISRGMIAVPVTDTVLYARQCRMLWDW